LDGGNGSGKENCGGGGGDSDELRRQRWRRGRCALTMRGSDNTLRQ